MTVIKAILFLYIAAGDTSTQVIHFDTLEQCKEVQEQYDKQVNGKAFCFTYTVKEAP